MINMDYKNKYRAERIENEIERISKWMYLPETDINESSLSRVWRHSEEFDIAILSAFRDKNIKSLNIKIKKSVYTDYHSNLRLQ